MGKAGEVAAVDLGVLDQVGHDPFEPAPRGWG
jgi:hypothetical protein